MTKGTALVKLVKPDKLIMIWSSICILVGAVGDLY